MNIIQFLILDCSDSEVLKIVWFIKTLFNLALIILPIGAIIMLSLDMAKNVIAGKEDDMSKNLNIFIKRIISLACVFLVYIIVNFVMNFISDSGVSDSMSWVDCWTKASASGVEEAEFVEDFYDSFDDDVCDAGWVEDKQKSGFFDKDMRSKSTDKKQYICTFKDTDNNDREYYCTVCVPE